MGAHNQFHAGCVIGDAPQDLKYQGAATSVRIGEHNVFREHVTVHRATGAGEETVIGSHNFLMGYTHVGHNVVVGDHVITVNGAMLGGYAVIEDQAFLSGNGSVHQFCRIGRLSMMQGGTVMTQDLPPFTTARRVNELCGLNIVGLRRAGFTAAERLELKQLYRALFRSGQNLRQAVIQARTKFKSPAAQALLSFVSNSKRGVCTAPHGRFSRVVEEERD
jgi:UDP-N-acetylglucosamine acyltransferase